MQPKKHNRLGLFVSLAIIGLTALIWYKQSAIFDTIRLYGYVAPAPIAKLASDTTMTPSTRRLFYVYHPAIEDKQSFGAHCTDSEKTIVLGCFISRKGIYLYDVSDPRLEGVEQVTAAHETLHAVYDRLSPKERAHVDAMTAQAFSQVTDPRIKATIESYRQKDAAVVPNELHSILGTEVRNLPPDLEAYYKQYFTDRSAVVGFSEQYESEFTSREQQQQDYDAQLKTLKGQIDSLNASLTTREQQINNDYKSLLQLKQSGNTEAYNSGVPAYNAEVNSYNRDVAKVQQMIKQYNEIVEKRNALVVEEGQLLKAIDSRPQTIQSQ